MIDQYIEVVVALKWVLGFICIIGGGTILAVHYDERNHP